MKPIIMLILINAHQLSIDQITKFPVVGDIDKDMSS